MRIAASIDGAAYDPTLQQDHPIELIEARAARYRQPGPADWDDMQRALAEADSIEGGMRRLLDAAEDALFEHSDGTPYDRAQVNWGMALGSRAALEALEEGIDRLLEKAVELAAARWLKVKKEIKQ